MLITDLDFSNEKEVRDAREFKEWLATCACMDCTFIPNIKHFVWLFEHVGTEDIDPEPMPDYKGPGIYDFDGNFVDVELDGFCPELQVYFDGYHDFIKSC